MKIFVTKLTTAIAILVVLVAQASTTMAWWDIASGGAPTITGGVSGTVTGSSSTSTDLFVTINFGEVSPANTNSYVKVTVPVMVRADQDYRVTATISGGTNANAQALQRSDIGFGLNNMRRLTNGKVCNRSSHIIAGVFGNDPATNLFISASGRVAFPSSLNDVTTGTLLLSGPTLGSKNRNTDNGWAFDAIFVVAPQFFANGSTTATITLTISNGFNVAC